METTHKLNSPIVSDIRVTPRIIPFRCPNCKGYGTVQFGKKRCHTCNGSGIILVNQQDAEFYAYGE